jgi:predicted nucleic acid-binding protein
MIFIDANVILRALVQPSDAHVSRLSQISGDLLRQADRGEVEITTSDAVLAEVAFVLTGRAHANLPVALAADLIASIVRLRGFRHGAKRSLLRALELWGLRPSIGFVDALTAAYAQTPGMQLATFDEDFATIPGIDRWRPETLG